MIKPSKQFFLIFFLSALVTIAKAQLLNNTRWRAFDQQNNFDLFWNFNNDTVATSSDNSIWTNVSVYAEGGNILTFRNLNSSECDSNDVGIYYFNIIQDTLRLTEFNEPCATRASYFNTHYFVDFPIGIDEIESSKEIDIFPLPFNRELNVKTEGGRYDFLLLDVNGRSVIVKPFQDQLKINTESLEPGIYLYEIRNVRFVRKGTLEKH